MTTHVERLRHRGLKGLASGDPPNYVEDLFGDHIPWHHLPHSVSDLVAWITDLEGLKVGLETVRRAEDAVSYTRIASPGEKAEQAVTASVAHQETVGKELLAIKDAVTSRGNDHPRAWAYCLDHWGLHTLVATGRDLCGIGRPPEDRRGPSGVYGSGRLDGGELSQCAEVIETVSSRLYRHLQLVELEERVAQMASGNAQLSPSQAQMKCDSVCRVANAADGIEVDIEKRTVSVAGKALPIGSEKAARYLKVLVDRAGCWVSSSDLWLGTRASRTPTST